MTAPSDIAPTPGRNCWRIVRAERAAIIIDAADYFRVARAAMLQARRRIMLVGWDFDARVELEKSVAGDDGPAPVGEFICWLVERNPELEVYLLRWDVGAMKSFAHFETLRTVAKWMRHPRIHTKLDGSHPPGSSHHQKIIAIDDCFAFCGGIDVTGDRWDTRAHRDDDAGRIRPNGKPYGPWHDATSAVQGPAAAALGEVCRDRWQRAGCDPIEPVTVTRPCWPEGLPVDFRDVDVAISRSEPAMPDQRAVLEIEQLYIDQIAAARRYIYAENQYFASRRVAEAIAARLDGDDCPEIVLVNPLTSEGWLQPLAMDTARARLIETLNARDRHGRLRVYIPYTEHGVPIYVHAKVMMIDDEVLRIGSSNMNNRSMRLDTECDVTFDASIGENATRISAIRDIRDGLVAEHLGLPCDEVAAAIIAAGSLIAAIEALRARGARLRPYEVPELSEVQAWLAENEVLDPEGSEEMFEPLAKRSLLQRLRRR